MLFDKELFAAKYVEPGKRVKVDTLVLIGNGFDIWQGLNTSFRSFEKYYEEHLEEVLRCFHLKSHTGYDKEGKLLQMKREHRLPILMWNFFMEIPFNRLNCLLSFGEIWKVRWTKWMTSRLITFLDGMG